LSWQFDEDAHAGREHLDADYVAAYDEKSPTDWSEDVQTLLEFGIGTASAVVDLGAGTGTFARAIAPHVARVVAVDVSEPMVEAMRARGLEAVRAGFLTYVHEGEPPDAVFTRNALHHLPDFWKAIALGRVAELLRPGGVLRLRDLVYSFEPGEADAAIADWLAGAPDDPCARLDGTATRRARPRGALDIHLAARTDARTSKFRDPRSLAEPDTHLRRVHLRPAVAIGRREVTVVLKVGSYARSFGTREVR
jgi:SAM-dependent methyltransferase